MPYGLETFVVESGEAVEYGTGREGQRSIVVVDGAELFLPVHTRLLVEVFQFVLTQRRISFQCQPRGDVPSSRQFNTHAVRLLDVGSQIFSDVAQCARLHELVIVVHII